MLTIKSQKVYVKSVAVRGCSSASGDVRYSVRAVLEHEPDSEAVLPEVRGAVKAILREQLSRGERDDNDESDVITLKLKRALPRCRYQLGIADMDQHSAPELVVTESTRGSSVSAPTAATLCDFIADVVLQPSVAAVHGMLKVRWTVEAQLTRDSLVSLCSMIGNEYVTGTIAPQQGVIPFASAAE